MSDQKTKTKISPISKAVFVATILIIAEALLQLTYYVMDSYPHLMWVKSITVVLASIFILVIVGIFLSMTSLLDKALDKTNDITKGVCLIFVGLSLMGVVSKLIEDHVQPVRSQLSKAAIVYLEQKERENKTEEQKRVKREIGQYGLYPLYSVARTTGAFSDVRWPVVSFVGTVSIPTSERYLFHTLEFCKLNQNVYSKIFKVKLSCKIITE